MGFEPQKLFVGLIDFFAVLLPGAVVAYLWRDPVSRALLNVPAAPLNEGEAWVVFLFVSYLVGHLTFLVGSLLDDYVYAPIRGATTTGQIRRLASGKPLNPRFWRWLSTRRWLFDSDADIALDEVSKHKARVLEPEFKSSAVNAFQWCKARLSKEHPDGLATVQRFEADSKFFRSFSFVLVVVSAVFLVRGDTDLAGIAALLLFPVLWRYVDQRFKATQQAYWQVIALAAATEKKPASRERVVTGGRTHAGGIVFRQTSAGPQFLIVRSTNDREWVLPKGHIESGESERVAAVREVLEETGYWGLIHRWVKDVTFDSRTKVRFYLMEWATAETFPKHWPPEERRHEWCFLGDAKAKTDAFKETGELLDEANKLIPTIRPLARPIHFEKSAE